MNRTIRMTLLGLALGVGAVATQTSPITAATAPGRITFLAASCPSSSSMYTRVVSGQDPNSGEHGTAADPADIAAYGCTETGSMGLFLLANSTTGSVFLDEAMQQPAAVSTSAAGPAGSATIMQTGTTVFVPGGIAQTRRFSVSNYPTTISSRAAMPFLDLQCLTDGNNSDNADGAGWGNQAIASGAQTYCIAYVWDGVSTATATPSPSSTPTAVATATATPTPSTGATAVVTVNFPGLSSTHVYAHTTDGAVGTASGAQIASSTWKTSGTTMTVNKGTYDIRVVHGPMVTVIDNVSCSADCTVNVPMATLTVNFPGLANVHSYAHKTDGAAGTFGAEDSSSTWKANTTSMVLLQGVYDVRVVHGPMASVFDDIDCRAATCSVTVPTATLTVNFPGLANVHSYAHKTDGAAGTYGAEDSSSTWKANTTSMVLLQGVYDVRVVHGPMASVFDDIDCRDATCSVTVPTATLTVNFPGLANVHSYAHKADGAAGTYGAEDSSSTWKANTTSMVLLQGVYDVRVVHGPMASVFDDIDCRDATCVVDVPLAELTVTFPGHTNVHTYVKANDNVGGAATGAEDSSSTWKTNGTSFVLLRGVYDVVMQEGSASYVVDAVDCRSTTCSAAMPSPTTTATPSPTASATATSTPPPATATASGSPAVTGTATAAPSATVKKTFVSADKTKVTWKLEPSAARDLQVWDEKAVSCEAFNGASCGKLGQNGSGMFTASSPGQYFLVTQDYELEGEKCEVENVAEWSSSDAGEREKVVAKYTCSGASTMGWGLFGLFAFATVGLAWVVQRKSQWSH